MRKKALLFAFSIPIVTVWAQRLSFNPTPGRLHPSQSPSEEPVELAREFVFESSYSTLTDADVTAIKGKIVNKFGLAASYGDSCNGKLISCPMGDNMGALLRLAFHDAAGYSGPNGCIDFTATENNGLQEVVATLNQLYAEESWNQTISKADLYVLAANTVIFYATTDATHQNKKGWRFT